MQQSAILATLSTSVATAVALVAYIFISPQLVLAGEKVPGAARGDKETATCTCPQQKSSPWSRPKFADLKLGEKDEIAALESVQYALTEVGDGATYVWHRHEGHLSGFVQPTTSFKDGSGKVCRHVVVMLSSALRSRKAEGIACRLDGGVWQLEG